MKKALLSAALVFGVLVSCKKSNNPAGGVTNFDSQHLTCAIDGVATSFNANLMATRTTTTTPTYPLTEIAITGYTGTSGSNIPGLGIGWSNTSANVTFGTGTWIDTSSKYAIFGIYAPISTDTWDAGTAVWQTTLGTSNKITNDLVLTITYMDSTGVKGTFSGEFFDGGLVSAAKKVITNGDFVVRWK